MNICGSGGIDYAVWCYPTVIDITFHESMQREVRAAKEQTSSTRGAANMFGDPYRTLQGWEKNFNQKSVRWLITVWSKLSDIPNNFTVVYLITIISNWNFY